MIFITAKFPVRPEHAEDWPRIARAFTEATRAEPGCPWFEWSRSVDDPHEYVLVEAFRDEAAGAEHVRSPHFAEATRSLGAFLRQTPGIVSVPAPGQDWSELAEIAVPPGD